MRGKYLSKKVTVFLPLLHTAHFSAATCVPITAVLIISRPDFNGIHKNGFNLFWRNTCGMDKNNGVKQQKTNKRADIAVTYLTLIRTQAGTLPAW